MNRCGNESAACRKRRHGFTLIEVLAVLAIVAILAALAYPSYQSSLRKGRRADATMSLLQIQLQQERYRSLHPRYAASLAELGWGADPAASPGGYYTLSLELGLDLQTGFRARAVSRPGTDQSRDRCAVFVLDQDGPDRLASSAPDCWPG